MKKFRIITIMSFLLAGLTACGGDVNWKGTFYMEVDEYNTYVFDIIEVDESGFSFENVTINTYGGGTAATSVTGSANIIKGNTAENSNYEFSLSGDTLTVKVPEPDELIDMFAGKYTRGEPLPPDGESEEDESEESADSDVTGDDAGGGAAITTASFYYWNGDSELESLFFYSDGTARYDGLEERTSSGTYAIDGNELTISWDSGYEAVFSIEDNGATVIDEQGEAFYLAE